MSIIFLVISIIEFLIIVVFGVYGYLGAKGRRKLVDNANSIVKGNLNIDDISATGLSGDTEIIAGGLNSIKTNLLTFVESTKLNVVVLADAVEALTESMKNNQNGNEMIAKNSAEVDERTVQQLKLVEENLRMIDANSEKMKEMVDSIESISSMLDESVSMSMEGVRTLENYECDMDVVSSDLDEINKTLESFNDEIRKIYEVGDFIVGISNQLKLLSFNASIEASRAGQFGRGFSVVADEMTGMSEQTREGMNSINQILESVMNRSKDVTESIKKCSNTYSKSKNSFEKVNVSFRLINDKSSEIRNNLEQIEDIVENIANNSEQSKVMADDLYASAQIINQKTGDMASISEEVAAEAVHIGENTKSLDGMLQRIEKLLKRFNTGTVPTSKKPLKSVKIAMLSMYDNDFWYGVKRGANYAETELLGCDVQVEFVAIMPDVDQEQFLADTFMRLIDEKYDGIIYPGFLGGVAPYLKRAKDAGIHLMTFNCDVDNKMLREVCIRSDSIVQGQVCAKAAERLMNSSGDAIIMMGNPDVKSNVERSEGFKKALASSKLLHVTDEIVVKDDGDEVYRKTCELLKSRKPDIIYLTSGYPFYVAKAIVDSGAKGKTKLIGYDLAPVLFQYIRNGVIGSIISQDSFGQGHDPIVWMYNHIVTGESYPCEYIDCRLSVADASNIEDLIEAE